MDTRGSESANSACIRVPLTLMLARLEGVPFARPAKRSTSPNFAALKTASAYAPRVTGCLCLLIQF